MQELSNETLFEDKIAVLNKETEAIPPIQYEKRI